MSGAVVPAHTALTVNVLIVGGGGGGGNSGNGGVSGGGGGGGGVVAANGIVVTAGTPVTIVVGNGGAGADGSNLSVIGGNGGSSSFGSSVAMGGGGGGSYIATGAAGGSGGGGPANGAFGAGAAGQGSRGGSGYNGLLGGGAGGGGASAIGGDGLIVNGGAGGAGVANAISGASLTYGGGGGGASRAGIGGTGGSGGGGAGATGMVVGSAGAAATGGGGGGSVVNGTVGAAGASGVVIVSYPTGTMTAFGGTITTAGGNTIHTFTSNGTFSVGPPPPPSASYLILAGGGGGGTGNSPGYSGAGGGGGGGALIGSGMTITPGSYSVVVGAGGSAAPTNGGNSTFNGLTAIGGGKGGTGFAGPGGESDGAAGASGGGGGGSITVTHPGGGATSGQGHAGGAGLNDYYGPAGGGGGGAGSAGANANGGGGGAGGSGVASSISGTSVLYGGGGGGAGWSASYSVANGAGGPGGGGAGNHDGAATAGTANRGGGGGGGQTGGAGGSGVVIISYPTGSLTATGGTITTSGGNTIHTFTANGIFATVGTVDHVIVTPVSPLVEYGDGVSVSAQAYDASNHLLPDTSFQWQLTGGGSTAAIVGGSNAAVVSGVTAQGSVTASASGVSGTATFSVTSQSILVYDSFSGVNGTPLASHSPDLKPGSAAWSVSAPGPTAVLSGQHLIPASADWNTFINLAHIDASTANGIVGVDWTPASGGTWSGYPIGGVMFRVHDDLNYLVAGYGLSGGYPFSVWQVVQNSWTLLASADIPPPALGVAHRLEVRMSGSTIQVSSDGQQLLQTSSTYNLTETRHGLRWISAYDWISSYDNFVVKTLPSNPVSSVVVTPVASALEVGGSTALSAAALDAAGNLIPGALLHWTISNNSAAQIESGGYFTASGATIRGVIQGVTVTATSSSGISGSASINVDASHTIVFDTFSGADGTSLVNHVPDINLLNGQWTIPNSVPAVLSGQRVKPSGQDFVTLFDGALFDAGTADARLSVDFAGATAGTFWGYPIGGLMFRVTDSLNYFSVMYGNNGPLTLYKVAAGIGSVLGTATVPSPAGRTQRLSIALNGPNITVSSDGAVLIEATDPFNQHVTRHGLQWVNNYDAVSTYDNFAIRTFSTVTPASIVVTPALATVDIGETQTVVAQVLDGAGVAIASALVHWTISDPAAARLEAEAFFAPSAIVRGITAPVTVTASTIGGLFASASFSPDASGTRVFDTFSDIDGTHLSSHAPDINLASSGWTLSSAVDPIISSDRLESGGVDYTSLNNGAIIPSGVVDGKVSVDWTGSTGGQYWNYPIGGLAFRVKDAANYFSATYLDGTLGLWKFVNNTSYQLGSASVPWEAGRTQRLEVSMNGPNIEVRSDGVLKIQATDFFNVTESRHGPRWTSTWDQYSTYDNFAIRGTPPCVTGLSATNLTVPAWGGSGTITVNAPSSCSWILYQSAPWLSQTSGTGSATLTYSVPANSTPPNSNGSPRSFLAVVGGVLATLTQPPMPNPCWVSASWPISGFNENGGQTFFYVSTALPQCQWSVTTDVDWITLLDTAGVGAGMPRYSVAPNPVPVSRAGTITVGSVSFNVSQFAGANPPPGGGGSGGGSGSTGSTLSNNQVLTMLTSPDGRFQFTYQSSGNIVLTQGTTVLWASGTSGPGYAVMQGDGNFVRYPYDGSAPWHTHTYGHDGATLTVQNDGSVVIKDVDGSLLWSTTTGSQGTGGGGGTGDGGTGGSCSLSVSPYYILFGSGGNSRSVTVSASDPGCQASVSPYESWITLNTTQGGGTWTTTVTVGPNPTVETRATVLNIGGATIVIDQNGAGTDALRLLMLGAFVPADNTVTLSWTLDFATGLIAEQGCDPARGCFPVTVVGSIPTPPGLGYIPGDSSPDGCARGGNWWDFCGGGNRFRGFSPEAPPDKSTCVDAPAGVDVNANATEAQGALATAYATLPPALRSAYIGLWFASRVQPGGPWDYAHAYQPVGKYRALGNYNYGYIGSVLGFTKQTLFCWAGILQVVGGHYDPTQFGVPCVGDNSQGDDPVDHANIITGIYDYVHRTNNRCRQ